ncbi:MAG: hypothetical protein AB1402_05490 [Bacillota bacterium]
MRTVRVTEDTQVETVWSGECPAVSAGEYGLKLFFEGRKRPLMIVFSGQHCIADTLELLNFLWAEALYDENLPACAGPGTADRDNGNPHEDPERYIVDDRIPCCIPDDADDF